VQEVFENRLKSGSKVAIAPSPIAPARVLAALMLAIGIACAMKAAPASAAAGLACPDPTAQVFAPWTDYAQYAFAPNGGFESGATGWTLSGGAKVVAGNESFFVHGTKDRYALSLPPGSTATTAPMCVSLFSTKMRFFAANAGASQATLRVQVIYNGGVGSLVGLVGKTLGVSEMGSVTAGSVWQPSAPVGMLGGTLPLLTKSVQFRFSTTDRSGSWRIDDVCLDPLMQPLESG
jgi:hypothetical protein